MPELQCNKKYRTHQEPCFTRNDHLAQCCVLLLVGVDTATVYTRKDVAGEELEGEPDLLGHVRLPKDLCVALTHETNGSVFRFALCSCSVLADQ